MAGNSIRGAAKLAHDRGYVTGEEITVETASGIKQLHLYLRGGKVSSARVEMGKASLHPADLPCTLTADPAVDVPVTIAGQDWRVTCVSMGNPHCVVFCPRVDAVDLENGGPAV